MPTLHFIAASDITSAALGNPSQGDGSQHNGGTITFSEFSTLQSFDYTDDDDIFADNDGSQIITGGGTLGLTVGDDFEAEYTVIVQDSTGKTYTLYALSTGPGYTNVVGLTALDEFPPLGEALTVISTSEGPPSGNTTSTFERIADTLCFAAGTRIRTPQGYRAIETLVAGDEVITRDHGVQKIRWVGGSHLTAHELDRTPTLAPVVIAVDAFGPGVPAREISVSPMHRILLSSWRATTLFGSGEVLATARSLIGQTAIRQPKAEAAHYFHILFDRHEVIEADGLWSESFQPFAGVDALAEKVRDEMFAIFPELRNGPTDAFATPARALIRDSETAILMN